MLEPRDSLPRPTSIARSTRAKCWSPGIHSRGDAHRARSARGRNALNRQPECAAIGTLPDTGARDQLVLDRYAALELRHHLGGEEPQARLGDVVWHAAVAEDRRVRLGTGAALDVEDLLVAH